MHAGKLTSNTKASQVFAFLAGANGHWVSTWVIARECKTACVSTRISEIRHGLAAWPARTVGLRLEVQRRSEGGRQQWYYRIVERSGDGTAS